MTVTEIKQKLHQYIETAQEKKLKAIYTIVENEAGDDVFNQWDDKSFRAELKRREKAFLAGTAKTYTLENSMTKIIKAVKAVRKK